MGLPGGFIENMSGKSISETQDVSSKGLEFELFFNPDSYWTSKITIARQQTIDSNMSPNIQRYFDERLPVWEKVINPLTGEQWWNTRYGSDGTPRAFYEGVVLAPYKLAVANQGKPRSQVREWRVNASSSYQLAGCFPTARVFGPRGSAAPCVGGPGLDRISRRGSGRGRRDPDPRQGQAGLRPRRARTSTRSSRTNCGSTTTGSGPACSSTSAISSRTDGFRPSGSTPMASRTTSGSSIRGSSS